MDARESAAAGGAGSMLWLARAGWPGICVRLDRDHHTWMYLGRDPPTRHAWNIWQTWQSAAPGGGVSVLRALPPASTRALNVS